MFYSFDPLLLLLLLLSSSTTAPPRCADAKIQISKTRNANKANKMKLWKVTLNITQRQKLW